MGPNPENGLPAGMNRTICHHHIDMHVGQSNDGIYRAQGLHSHMLG